MAQAANFVRHDPCDECGSSDAKAVYDDGHTYCFSCSHRTVSSPESVEAAPAKPAGNMIEVEVVGLPKKRKLSYETCEKYSYGKGYLRGKPVQVAQYHDRETKRVVAQKVRHKDKTFEWLGDPKRAGLFGAHLCRDGGRRIVITEGEIDAMSVSQAQGNRWQVVSLPNGASAAAKAIKKELEWLETYETVVLCFDMDEPGREAVEAVAELFTPGKCHVASLPMKDANEMVAAGKSKRLNDLMWDASPYRPDGVEYGETVIDAMLSLQRKSGLEYPCSGLTQMTRGFRPGEIVTLCAGTGIGKSTFTVETAANWFPQVTDRVGYIALEENYGLTGLKFCTTQAGRPLHLDETPPNRKELTELYKPFSDRLVLYNHFGSIASNSLLSKIRYMVVGLECKWLVLDHLSIVVSGMDQNDDERRTIDHLMTSLRSLVEQTQAGLLLVSHLKRLHGAQKGYEQGTEPQLSHLRGSAAIEQLSDMVIAISRNQQDEEGGANLAKLRVLKNRWTGQTGTAGFMQYSLDSGRLKDCAGPDDDGDTSQDFAAEPSEFDVPKEPVTAS